MEDLIQKLLFNPTVGKIVVIFIGIGLIWVIVKSIQRSFLSKIKDNDNRYRTKKLSGFIGFLLTVILISLVYSDKLGGLTVAFGVAGAGIAFALQEVIVSFAGWLTIIVGGFYKTGDRIQLGGIGVLRTTIMETGQWVDGDLYNGRIVYVANSFVFKEPVYNYSRDFPFLWDEIKIPIQYVSNYEKTNEILLKIGKEVCGDLSEKSKQTWDFLQYKYHLENAQTEPMVSLVANDNWVEYTPRYVVDYKRRRKVKTELFTKILNAIEATNGEIKFASATFHLVEAPEIKVKIDS